jgi:quercetin dioxygenase-like cupin family protein
MFYKQEDMGFRPLLPGITYKTLVYGDKSLLAEFHLDHGSLLPRHSHPHEQSGYVVSGRLKMTIGDVDYEAGPGYSWCIPGGVEHCVDVLENSVVIEVFSPVREDYLT